ncbi:MAG: hypothetical protein ACOC9W_05310 [Persicimonas sp.]
MKLRLTTLLAVLLLLGAGTACGDQGDEAQRDSDEAARADKSAPDGIDQGRKRDGDLSTDGLNAETLDLNDDDEPDQWTFKSGDGPVRIERDMNFDGKIDLWQYFDAEGDVVEEEMDLDLDGRVDVVAYYKDGVVTRKAMSINFDDKFTIVKFYNKDGQLLRVERDQNADGRADVFEYYNSDGQRERIGWDKTGDGVPDEFDNL